MQEKYCVLFCIEPASKPQFDRIFNELMAEVGLLKTEQLEDLPLIVFETPNEMLDTLVTLAALLHQKQVSISEKITVAIDRGHLFHLADQGGVKRFTGSCIRVARRLLENAQSGNLRFTQSALGPLSTVADQTARYLLKLAQTKPVGWNLYQLEISWSQFVEAAGGLDTVVKKLQPPLSKEAIETIITKLAARIGPVAEPLVQDALQNMNAQDAVIHLAEYINNANEKKAFKQEMNAVIEPSVASQPKRAQKIEELEKLLASHVGPIAHLLLEQAAPRTGQTLLQYLRGQIPDQIKADQFMHEAMRLMRGVDEPVR